MPASQQEYDMTSPTMCLPVGTTIHPMGYGMSFLQHGGHYVARPGNAKEVCECCACSDRLIDRFDREVGAAQCVCVGVSAPLRIEICWFNGYDSMFIFPFLAPPTHMRPQPPQQYYPPQQMFVQQQQL
ncbi:unnamed protein product [Nippostrongylus brasiliensis]|uniref:FLZ-type domain-containing protein n=1 Tax=Nippostrongylus brasiliensis TaxID=27835 RepID=A0A0N4XN88_NIPBR|nr:unnamed protein product [Nippostrongylus brasiliensis]